MRIPRLIPLLTVLVPIGCGDMTMMRERPTADQNASAGDAAMNEEEEAANQIYLDDLVESAGEGPSEKGPVDGSVAQDTKGPRLEQMANMLFDQLDADDSGGLSLAEFLAAPGKRRGKEEPSAEAKAKVTERMTADFNQFAGADALLSLDELQTLLKEVAPRIGRHRHQKFDGQHPERVQQTWAEVVAGFDKDGDGKLSEAEYQALEADREARRESWKGRSRGEGPRGPGGPGPHGRGGRR